MALTINSAQYNSNAEYETVTGEIVSIDDAKPYVRMKRVACDINPVQTGSGDPSPDNVRPISGWSEAKVTRTGENLFDLTTFEQGSISSSTGEEAPSIGRIRSGYIEVSAGNYTVMNKNGFQIIMLCYDGSQQYIQAESWLAWSAGSSLDITIVNAKYVRIVFRKPDNSSIVPSEFTSGVFGGSRISVTIDLDGTRYGCTLDVRRGKLRVTHKILDMGDLDYTYDATYTRFVSTPVQDMHRSPSAIQLNVLSTMYQCISDGRPVGTVPDNSIYGGAGEVVLYIKTSLFTDPALFKTAVTGQKVVYPLATPVEVDLTPTEITTLLGTNNVWADTGDISVTYMAN